jgi:hypothetical protein
LNVIREGNRRLQTMKRELDRHGKCRSNAHATVWSRKTRAARTVVTQNRRRPTHALRRVRSCSRNPVGSLSAN